MSRSPEWSVLSTYSEKIQHIKDITEVEWDASYTDSINFNCYRFSSLCLWF